MERINKNIKFLLLFMACTYFVSCDIVLTEFDVSETSFELKDQTPQMGLYGYPGENKKGLNIELFKLVSPDVFIGDSLLAVKNAKIEIFENDKLISTLNPTTGTESNDNVFPNYSTPELTFTPGKEYTITVEADGYPDISASTVIPEPVAIDSVTTMYSVQDNEEGYLFRMFFTDPEQDNYYMVSVNHTSYYLRKIWHDDNTTYHLDTIYKTEYTLFPLGDHVFDLLPNQMTSVTEPYDISFDKPRIFTDELFKDQEYELKFFFPLSKRVSNKNDRGHYNSTIFLHSISEELFEGLKSHYQYKTVEGDIYAEPITLYNNINNGFGLWGGMATDSIDVPLILEGTGFSIIQ